MFHIWKLILISHRRKKHILWLMVCILTTILCMSFIKPIALGEGAFVSNIIQHQITWVIGILFIVYFWSTIIHQFNHTKITQLLRSKQKNPISFISQLRAGTYSIYFAYICTTYIIVYLLNDTNNIIAYTNLLISGATILTVTIFLSMVTNTYATMLWSFILYGISHSINFIIFSTPVAFKTNISYQILLIIQYLFPRFDLLYNTTWFEWIRAVSWNILYWIALYSIFVYVFLHQYKK